MSEITAAESKETKATPVEGGAKAASERLSQSVSPETPAATTPNTVDQSTTTKSAETTSTTTATERKAEDEDTCDDAPELSNFDFSTIFGNKSFGGMAAWVTRGQQASESEKAVGQGKLPRLLLEAGKSESALSTWKPITEGLDKLYNVFTKLAKPVSDHIAGGPHSHDEKECAEYAEGLSKKVDGLMEKVYGPEKPAQATENGGTIKTSDAGKLYRNGDTQVLVGKDAVVHRNGDTTTVVDGKNFEQTDGKGDKLYRKGDVTGHQNSDNSGLAKTKDGLEIKDSLGRKVLIEGKDIYKVGPNGEKQLFSTDKPLATQFLGTALRLHQYDLKHPMPESDLEHGVHVDSKHVRKVDDNCDLQVHNDGRRELILGKGEDKVHLYSVRGSNDLLAVVGEGDQQRKFKIERDGDKWKQTELDKDDKEIGSATHSSARRLRLGQTEQTIATDAEGSLSVKRCDKKLTQEQLDEDKNDDPTATIATFNVDGTVKGGKDLLIRGDGTTTLQTTLLNANGDGQDAVVTTTPDGKGTTLESTGASGTIISTVIEDKPGVVEQTTTLANGDKVTTTTTVSVNGLLEVDSSGNKIFDITRDATGKLTNVDVNGHNYKVIFENGQYGFITPDGDKVFPNGEVESRNGDRFHTDGRVEFKDGVVINADGTVLHNGFAIGRSGAEELADTSARVHAMIGAANDIAASVRNKPNPTAGDIALLLSLFSSLQGGKAVALGAGDLGSFVALDMAQAAVCGSISQARVAEANDAIVNALTAKATPTLLAELHHSHPNLMNDTAVQKFFVDRNIEVAGKNG